MLVSVDRTRVREYAPGLFSAKLIDGSRGAGQLSMLHGWIVPGAQHALHEHDTEELVYIISGHGIMEMDGRQYPVSAGHAMRFPRNVPHSTVNTHSTEDLVFVAVFADQVIDGRSLIPPARGRREGRLVPGVNRIRWVMRRLARRLAAALR